MIKAVVVGIKDVVVAVFIAVFVDILRFLYSCLSDEVQEKVAERLYDGMKRLVND